MVREIADFGHKWGKGFGKRATHPYSIFLGVHCTPSRHTPIHNLQKKSPSGEKCKPESLTLKPPV